MNRPAAFCIEQLANLANTDPLVWVLDADLADSYGALRFYREHPTRFIAAGISEQNMVSVAAGMASCGLKPWVFSFACFLCYRAADQIRVSLSQTGLPVVLVGSHAGGCGGRNGKTHTSTGDLALIGSMPGVEIWTPADELDIRYAVQQLNSRQGPAYLRLPRDPMPCLSGMSGVVRRLTDQAELYLLASGLSAHWALDVSRCLLTEGIRVTVVNISCSRRAGNDLDAIADHARRIYVIEDHVRRGGIADAFGAHTGRTPDIWFGWPEDWEGSSGDSDALRQRARLDTRSVCEAIRCDYRKRGTETASRRRW